MNDMKKIYGLMAVAALSASSAFAMEQLPGEIKDFDIVFTFDGANSSVSGYFVAPTQDDGYWDDEVWGTVYNDLTENIDLIKITRSSYEVGESDVLVAQYENVEPGKRIEFVDEVPIEYGHQYNYEIRPYRVKEDGSVDYPYGAYKYVYVGLQPGMPSISAELDADDFTKVNVKVTAPEKDANGNDFPEGFKLTNLKVEDYIDWNTSYPLKDIENPEFGQSYEFQLEFPEGVTKSIRVTAVSDFGSSYANTARVYVGRDLPGNPQNVKAVQNEDGSITVTWEPPVEGLNGGYYIPEMTSYRVHRRVSTSSYPEEEPIADNLNELTFTDDWKDVTSPAEFYYVVVAYNELGTGGKAESDNKFVLGPDYPLPFIENFNTGYGWNMSPDNLWSSQGGYISITSYDYKGIDGVDYDPEDYWNGDDGFLTIYLYSGDYVSGAKYESGKIDFKEAENPIMSFYTVGVKDNTNRIQVQLGLESESENFEILDFDPAEDAEENVYEWKKTILSLEDAVGESAKVAFFVYGEDDYNAKHDYIYIDKIVIDDYPSVSEIKYDVVDGKHIVSWTAPSNKSFGEPDAYEVYLDDAEPVLVQRPATPEGDENEPALLSDEEEPAVAAAWTPSYEFDAEQGKEYSVAVKPIYGDIHANVSLPQSFTGGVPSGVQVIGIDKVASVEYYDVNGLRVNQPAKGQVVIKRMIGENGAVKMKKVVF